MTLEDSWAGWGSSLWYPLHCEGKNQLTWRATFSSRHPDFFSFPEVPLICAHWALKLTENDHTLTHGPARWLWKRPASLP